MFGLIKPNLFSNLIKYPLFFPKNYVYAFEVSRYLVQEVDYIPWASANTALNYLDIVLSGSEVYDLFQVLLINFISSTNNF